VRLLRPSMLVFAVAVLASLSIHLPVYTALGELAAVLLHTVQPKKASPSTPVEFELVETDPKPPTDTAKPEPVKKPEELAKVERKPEREKPVPAKPKEPEPVVKLPENVQVVPVKPPPDDMRSKHAVTQKSDDPNVQPPDNPRFIAEENRRVAEETIANQRTTAEIDEQPTASAKSQNSELTGNSEKEDVAQLQEVQGEDSRNPKASEAREKPPSPSELGHGEKRDPAVAQAPKQGGSESQEPPVQREVAAGSERIGGEEQTVVVNDGAGTIRIHRAPQGVGPGNQGGEQQQGSRGQDSREVGARSGGGANLKLSFSQFEATFGSEELKKQRDAYLEQRRTLAKGGRNEEQWKKFRAAVENYVDQVKPGNQTALNAAASPFAAYLAAVHRNIHREFAMKFLRSLPLLGSPFADPNLRTRLSIVINQDGSLYQVGVIQTSGFTPYDFGAWNAVTKAAPFPEAPKKILSGDGRVYVHWDFYNNERQCGTFNAEPYILPMPDRKTPPAPGPLHDTGDSPGKGKMGRAPIDAPKRRLSALP
jgi:TonB C terminal